jgi:hypothetical protein
VTVNPFIAVVCNDVEPVAVNPFIVVACNDVEDVTVNPFINVVCNDVEPVAVNPAVVNVPVKVGDAKGAFKSTYALFVNAPVDPGCNVDVGKFVLNVFVPVQVLDKPNMSVPFCPVGPVHPV